MFEVIKDINEVELLEEELSSLYVVNQCKLTFYSPQYIIKGFREFLATNRGNSLYFIIYRTKASISQYLPLYIDDKHNLRFIFDAHTDYCDVIGEDFTFSALKALSNLILEDKNIKYVNLDNLLPESQLLNFFKHFLGLGTVITCYNNHSFLSKVYNDGLLNHLKSNQKSEIRRVQRKNAEFIFEIFNGVEPFPTLQIKDLRKTMIGNKIRDEHFFDDAFIAFSAYLYQRNELEIFTKWKEEKLISASMVLKNGRYRMVWIDLYAEDVQFINLSAYADYIGYLEQFDNIVFSFGRGSYDYKAKNFHPNIQNLYNLRYSKSKFNFFFSNYQGIKQFVKRLIKAKK
ncbi:hypothetical protein EZJ43_01065 [Pedobacter changchengzhani]|uniref:Uncharacterized protein n=1 Tax=Pedobacter changchengzhani TaxID=2529274 RepID=A0A4R5MQM1_9SPHI|nr:hypothetical protein [Pedobacter changchengzhani]TDG37715.1 hypothetical protein EZJ43_01065 [Pedobacter changchengzhani]